MKLAGLTPEQQAELPYDELCALRQMAYAERVVGMQIPEAIRSWASLMTATYGRTVRVWANDLPWITALLVVRYGEAIEHWPETFSDDDLVRARRWMLGGSGSIPGGVTMPERKG